jgi:TatD DNase family protein
MIREEARSFDTRILVPTLNFTRASDVMLIDTHIHLYLEQFKDDLDEVITRALDANVQIMGMPAINIPTIDQALEMCRQKEGLYAMTALHPSDVKDATDSDLQKIADYCSDPHIVAVGETGLDYYWDQSFNDKQKRFLRGHLEIAEEADLPIVFHNRDASEDLIKELRSYIASSSRPERIRGIFHCFGGPIELAAEVMELVNL